MKPEFWTHPVLGKLSDASRLIALGLLSIADDDGYFIADPHYVNSQLFPFTDRSVIVQTVLVELEKVGWIMTKNHPTHGPVGIVINFKKHQVINRPSPSKLKSYFITENSVSDHVTLTESSVLEQGTGNREIRENENSFPTWWKSYDEYKELVRQGFNAVMDDLEWLEHQQRLNPGLHIQRSCRKAYENYWSREERWKKIVTGPIKRRPRKLNMKNALADSLGWSAYKSYLTREE